MIHVTERAKYELKKLLNAKVDLPWARLRLMDRGKGKFGLGIDVEAPGDYVVEYKGKKVLVIEPVIAISLNDIIIDIDDTDNRPELVILERF